MSFLDFFKQKLLGLSIVIVHFIFVKFAFVYSCFYVIFIILSLSGDVELNPGPRHIRHRQCSILYANIRGLHGNLNDLMIVS